MKFTDYIGTQFGNPRGIVGKLCCIIMNVINKKLYIRASDAVTSVNTIYFWTDTVKGLTEIKRVLKDDGIFVSAVYSKEWLKRVSYTKNVFKFFSKEDYIADGKKAGFSDVVIEEVSSGKSYLIKYIK